VIAAFLAIGLLMTSCGSPDYHVFSLGEGIGHFSLEYPPAYKVTRIDIRNEMSNRYTDIGLADKSVGLHEISVYAWPAGPGDETASLILDNMLGRAGGVFLDFNVLDRYSVMIGDIEGQAARFSWDAAASVNATVLSSLPAVSSMVCFRHGDLAWEINVASDAAAQTRAKTEFQHIIDTFQILP